jgi:hypothetical protein
MILCFASEADIDLHSHLKIVFQLRLQIELLGNICNRGRLEENYWRYQFVAKGFRPLPVRPVVVERIFEQLESLARVNCLVAVSFLPKGLPGGADFRAGLEGSRCWVSSCQVRPHQISRTVFSPTPYFRAKTALQVFLVFGSDADGLSSNIATACSEVRIARGLATFPDLYAFDMSFSSCATIFRPEGGFQKKRMQNILMS